MKAGVFPGQGAQHTGMGQALYQENDKARDLFEQANQWIGFRLTDTMFTGSAEDLKQTHITQPAVFVHAVIVAKTQQTHTFEAVAGHSLGEFTALVMGGALSFEEALKLVCLRAQAMQKACELRPSTMAAVLGLSEAVIEDICGTYAEDFPDEIVVPANYNAPGQLVISGTVEAIAQISQALLTAGARRVVPLPVSGAFHSPLMEPARQTLAQAIQQAPFELPNCPIYQNATASPTKDIDTIKERLIAQLTAPVRWAELVTCMADDGVTHFVECGAGKVLQGLIRKILPTSDLDSLS